MLDRFASLRAKPLEEMTVDEARAFRRETSDVLIAMAGAETPLPRVENRVLDGVPVRIYWPSNEPELPVLVFYHGGGWVLGTLDQMDRPCRNLAAGSGAVVVSVDYRLAPEHKFPAPLEDAFTAARYVAGHADEFGVDAQRLAVGGDSAGGNLAAAVCLLARERGGPRIAFQLLIYPAVDSGDQSPSVDQFADGYLLTRGGLHWFWQHYLRTAADGRNPLASPLLADVRGLPPALVITAGCDPLRDQGEAYAAKLRAAGVKVELARYEETIHAFFQLGGVLDAGRKAVAQAADALRRM